MNVRPIVDPRLMARLPRAHYRQAVTIQQATETQGSDGEIVQAWADVPGLVDLPCQVSPVTAERSYERRLPDHTYQRATHKINVAGHYPAIVETMRAVVGGTAYDILLVTQTSQGDHTELVVELVR